eukprot:4249566-Pyramimonas_sp.AAC.1
MTSRTVLATVRGRLGRARVTPPSEGSVFLRRSYASWRPHRKADLVRKTMEWAWIVLENFVSDFE